MKLWIDNIRLARQRKIFPIYYCRCCRKCKYRSKTKSLFDESDLVLCADINGISIITIIPKVFYVINWCKLQKTYK